METVEELKRYVRFLYSSLQEKDRENRQVRDEMAEIKADNHRADTEAESRQRLFDKLERFMDSQKEADDEKKKLLRKIETLENRLALVNQALYGARVRGQVPEPLFCV